MEENLAIKMNKFDLDNEQLSDSSKFGVQLEAERFIKRGASPDYTSGPSNDRKDKQFARESRSELSI